MSGKFYHTQPNNRFVNASVQHKWGKNNTQPNNCFVNANVQHKWGKSWRMTRHMHMPCVRLTRCPAVCLYAGTRSISFFLFPFSIRPSPFLDVLYSACRRTDGFHGRPRRHSCQQIKGERTSKAADIFLTLPDLASTLAFGHPRHWNPIPDGG